MNRVIPEPLLMPHEVAALFRVDPKTVTRWAKAGRLTAIRTFGGHRRYKAREVYAKLQADSEAAEQYKAEQDQVRALTQKAKAA